MKDKKRKPMKIDKHWAMAVIEFNVAPFLAIQTPTNPTGVSNLIEQMIKAILKNSELDKYQKDHNLFITDMSLLVNNFYNQFAGHTLLTWLRTGSPTLSRIIIPNHDIPKGILKN